MAKIKEGAVSVYHTTSYLSISRMGRESERLVKTCCRVVVWFTGCLEITAEYPDCEESWRILEWAENKSYKQVF